MIDRIRVMAEGGGEIEAEKLRDEMGAAAGRILDVGAGSGMSVPGVAGSDVYGAERDLKAIAAAKSRGYSGLVCADAAKLPFAGGAFSAAVMCKLAHHLDDRRLGCAAREIWRVLEPGGRLVLLDPFAPNRTTSLKHNLTAVFELGGHLRNIDETLAFFNQFKLVGRETYRKKGYDFFILVFEKSNT